MAKLFLLRHSKSQWNKDNRFAGWADNPLSEEGKIQAKEIAEKLDLKSLKIDAIYSNALIRCLETILRMYDTVPNKYPLFLHIDGGKMQEWGTFDAFRESDIPTYVSEKLNERYYGDIQGLDKAETKAKYGEEQVQKWRRGYSDKPPGGESLKETCERVTPFFREHIEKDLQEGKNIMVVASHNSLRAIIKDLEGISDEDVVKLELPFGALLSYEFTDGKYTKIA